MKTVVYDPQSNADNINPAAMPAIGKSFEIGEPVVLTDEDAEIALTNPNFRLADEAPKAAAATPAVKPPEPSAPATATASPQTSSISDK